MMRPVGRIAPGEQRHNVGILWPGDHSVVLMGRPLAQWKLKAIHCEHFWPGKRWIFGTIARIVQTWLLAYIWGTSSAFRTGSNGHRSALHFWENLCEENFGVFDPLDNTFGPAHVRMICLQQINPSTRNIRESQNSRFVRSTRRVWNAAISIVPSFSISA